MSEQQPLRPAPPARPILLEWLVGGIALLLAIVALWLGRGWFVPMAIAWLAAVVLVAIFDRIARLRLLGRPLPGWAVYIVGLLGVVALVFAVTQVIISQMRAFALALPDYTLRIADLKLRLDEVVGPESTAWLWDLMASLRPSAALGAALNGVGAALGTLVLIVLYVAFMLVDGGSLARKIAGLGRDAAQRAQISTALAAIRAGIQQYMLVKTLISAGTAIVVYGLLRIIGVDFALTWAALTFFLNFIPSIGSIVATILPVAWAAVQFPTFGPPIATLVTVGAVQFVFGNILDPMLSGRRLNLGPLIIILSLSFWSMLWGITGALLAVPMTAVIAIVAFHVPPLRPLAVLLSGDDAPAEPAPVAYPAPAAPAPSPDRSGPPPMAHGFAADIAAIRADQAMDAEAAASEAARVAAPLAAATGVAAMLQAGVAEWLGQEIAVRTGLDSAIAEREVQAFLAQLAEDPQAYGTLAADAGAQAWDLLRRHPAAAALIGAALGFVLLRMRR